MVESRLSAFHVSFHTGALSIRRLGYPWGPVKPAPSRYLGTTGVKCLESHKLFVGFQLCGAVGTRNSLMLFRGQFPAGQFSRR